MINGFQKITNRLVHMYDILLNKQNDQSNQFWNYNASECTHDLCVHAILCSCHWQFNFNLSMVKYVWLSYYIYHNMPNEITYIFPDFNSVVREWISNFIPFFIMDVITYPSWD